MEKFFNRKRFIFLILIYSFNFIFLSIITPVARCFCLYNYLRWVGIIFLPLIPVFVFKIFFKKIKLKGAKLFGVGLTLFVGLVALNFVLMLILVYVSNFLENFLGLNFYDA